MTTIAHLHTEEINYILCDESISFKDIMSLALSFNQFYVLLTKDNALWRKKFYQRWPHLREEYDEQLCLENKDFLEHIKAGVKSKKELWRYLSQMSEKHYYKDDLFDVDFRDFNSLFDSDKGAYFMNYYFFVNELIRLLTESPMESDLTQRYYAEKLLSYLQHYRLRKKVHEFLNYPEKQQILEKAAFILAQWYQPQKYVSYLYVSTSLDKIAQQVLECLKNNYSAHPICSISREQLSFWKNNNIDDNHWNSIEGSQIIESLCKVLYNKLDFHGSTELDYLHERGLEQSNIDCVLQDKIGTTVILATIYHSVARRLGIRCDIIFRGSTTYLCWRPKYHTTNLREKECFCIDFMRNGQMPCTNYCPIINSAKYGILEYTKKSAVEVMSHMNANLYLATENKKIIQRSYLELWCLIKPDTFAIVALCDIYVQYQTDLSNLIVGLEEIQNNCKVTDPSEARYAEHLLNKFRNHINPVMPLCNQTPKQRTIIITFAVGMIVTFYTSFRERKFFLKNRGVIIGWDERRREYDDLMEICHLFSFREINLRPYYIVLCENGEKCYIPEVCLTKCEESVWINHKDIGRYFCKFEKSYYVPNKMLKKHYPHD
ncbi:F-box only protein 21-like [Linepithema humile]|uniref:F-box only protein 21-like n=1 Tax=Linepithema humile TaxID=83485 RepID=UPI00351DBC72